MTVQENKRDFASMSREEIEALTDEPGAVAKYATAVHVVTPDEASGSTLTIGDTMMSVTFRADVAEIEQVDRLAGRDKEGRSGVLRAALHEYLQRHGEAA